jgi:hypothetical protein
MSDKFEILAKLHGLDVSKNEHNYLNHTTEMCHAFYTANQSENLQLSLDIAQAAACFDDLQSSPMSRVIWPDSMDSVVAHVAKLHDIAIKLAGDQVDEVYCPDNPVKEAVPA